MEGWRRRKEERIRQRFGGGSGSFKCELKKRENFGGRKA